MNSNRICNNLVKIKQLIYELHDLSLKLDKCRLTKNKKFNGMPEYILFTVLSYSNLEVACNKLDSIMEQLNLNNLDELKIG